MEVLRNCRNNGHEKKSDVNRGCRRTGEPVGLPLSWPESKDDLMRAAQTRDELGRHISFGDKFHCGFPKERAGTYLHPLILFGARVSTSSVTSKTPYNPLESQVPWFLRGRCNFKKLLQGKNEDIFHHRRYRREGGHLFSMNSSTTHVRDCWLPSSWW